MPLNKKEKDKLKDFFIEAEAVANEAYYLEHKTCDVLSAISKLWEDLEDLSGWLRNFRKNTDYLIDTFKDK